jgi:hypothetical protein
MRENYLFGPFVGETIYELNYFVGHAIYLRKQNHKNRIIVLTRKENFDLYGKYATTLVPLPLGDELKHCGFECKNMYLKTYENIINRFVNKFRGEMRIDGHFYPKVSSYLKNIKWYYPRNEIDFDFRPRPRNLFIAKTIVGKQRKRIISDFHGGFKKISGYSIFPSRYILNDLHVDENKQASNIGVLIEAIKLSKYVHADIDSLTGRLSMLMKKPLITKREFLDAQYLNPINPYKSIVIGCSKITEGLIYLEKLK